MREMRVMIVMGEEDGAEPLRMRQDERGEDGAFRYENKRQREGRRGIPVSGVRRLEPSGPWTQRQN